MIDIRERLNASQLQAVRATEGPVLVLAGAGSGKTRVIEYRVLHLVQSSVNPSSILLLTFTRKAAREMLSRASQHDPQCKSVDGGTFHSFAYKTLKKYGKTIGLTEGFSVLDEGDAEEAIHRCSTRLGFFDKEKRFPRKDTLRSIISMSINKAVSVGDVLKKEYPHFIEFAEDIEKLRATYAEYKLKKNYIDYDDLLLFLRLLLDTDEMKARMAGRYRYVMVDEYQDTNKLQGEITAILAEPHRNIMVVGDDAQCIYGFRGSSHENIMRFPDQYPDCRVIKLEENYRSTQSVLNVANTVLENMKNKYSKCLVSARNVTGARPQLLFFRDAVEEAECVASKIKELRDEGTTLSHQAVLSRSSYISIPLQAELARRNIPYQTFGGLKFYETAHVKDVMAHLKVLTNPKDELSWNRVLMLIDGVGPRISDRLVADILAAPSFVDIVNDVFEQQQGRRFGEGAAKLRSVLNTAYNKSINVGAQLSLVLEYYAPILKNRFDDWHLRNNDLETLRQISMRYDSLEDFLADFAIEPPERGVWRVEPETPEEEKPLTLSTIHLAKGLEWDTVFLLGLIDGVLPVSFSLDYEDEIEEEQRIFYVAITRAKNNLFLTLHHEGNRGGISQFNKMSRFIDTPNVLSKLDVTGPVKLSDVALTASEPAEDIAISYDKEVLLKRLTDYLGKKPS